MYILLKHVEALLVNEERFSRVKPADLLGLVQKVAPNREQTSLLKILIKLSVRLCFPSWRAAF